MKLRMYAAATTALLSGCYFDSADLTINHDSEGGVSIVRTMGSTSVDSSEPTDTAGCIALPDSWTGTVSISVSGTAQGADFTTTPAADSSLSLSMNNDRPVIGYEWQCFADSRTYSADDRGEAVFSLTPGLPTMTVLTSIGVVSRAEDSYQDQIASHLLLSDADAAPHWQKVASQQKLGDYTQTLPGGDAYYIYLPAYESGAEQDAVLRIDQQGVHSAPLPFGNALAYLNGKLLTMEITNVEGRMISRLSVSEDLVNWTNLPDAEPPLGGIIYDRFNQRYIAQGGVSEETLAIYTSDDLQSWTELANTIGYNTIFYALPNGNLIGTDSYGEQGLFLLSAGSSTWTALNPPGLATGEVFRARQIVQTDDGTVHVAGVSGVDSGSEEGGPWTAAHYGFSSDGVNWTWRSAGEWSNPKDIAGLAVNGQQVVVWGYQNVQASPDAGQNWISSDAAALAAGVWDALPEDAALYLNDVSVHNDQFIFQAYLSVGAESIALALATSDFTSYRFLGMQQGLQLLTGADVLFARVDGGNNGHSDVYTYKVPDTGGDNGDGDNGDSDNGDGDSSGGDNSGGDNSGACLIMAAVMVTAIMATVIMAAVIMAAVRMLITSSAGSLGGLSLLILSILGLRRRFI